MTAAATRTGGVVGALDARTPTRFYWSLTLLATIGGFLFGFDTSNIGSVLGFIPGTRMPESPRWLLRQGRYEDARAALAKLGVDVSTEEVRDAAAEIVSEKETGPRRRLWTPGVKRALMVVCVFFTFQQITGINVPLYYGPKLLGPLFQTGDSKVAEVLAGVQVTAIMTVVNVAPTYLAFRYIDRAGRRPLAIGGSAGDGGVRVHRELRARGWAAPAGSSRARSSPPRYVAACAKIPLGSGFRT